MATTDNPKKEKQSNNSSDIESVKPYFSLSPRDDLDIKNDTKANYEHYEQKLKWALNNAKKENIKNIAITGYYGSGKSSILKTFIKNHHSAKQEKGKYKFLELSLATFHDDKEGSEKVKDIEKSLLQQIFYKVEDDQIPNSRFSKITKRENFNFFEQGLLSIILLLVLVRLYNLAFGIEPLFGFYWLDILLVISTLFIVLLKINMLNKLSFKRLSYKSLEVEIEKNKSELSVLSRFLDEIIYFFKETKYNVVLIEDIDRFESTEVFSNLRELNLILNNSDLIKEHIVFIYAIKNEQFKTASDRTKFFDFIIPVIPVVNFETSANHFIKSLEESDIDIEYIDRNMISSLFYLNDDLRIINNIFNELKTYHKVLEKNKFYNGLDDKESKVKVSLINRLIPLLFYKNVEPYDFARLLKREGFLYQVINFENEIKIKVETKIEQQIKEMESKINGINENTINNINEVKFYILNVLLNEAGNRKNKISSRLQVKDDSDNFTSINYNNLNKFDSIFDKDKFEYKEINSNWSDKMTKVELEKILKFSVTDKIEVAKNNSKINELRHEIKDNQFKIQQINNKSLAQIINNKDIKEIILTLNEKNQENKNFTKPNDEFISTLILNDYINKDYFLYLSDYTKLGISEMDFKILLSIKNKKNIGFEKPIEKPEIILARISPSDFYSNAILNFDLIDYIIKTSVSNFPEKINHVADWISDFSITSKEFIIEYYQKSYNVDVFIYYLSLKSKNLWIRIIDDNLFEKHRDNLYELIINKAPKERIVDYCHNADFSAYIEEDKSCFLNIENYKLKYIIDNVKEPIKLTHINTDGSVENLKYIFTTISYKINLHNINAFIELYAVETKGYENKLLTFINQQEGLVELRDYIYSIEKFEEFLNKIILKDPLNTKEEEAIVLEILDMPKEKISLETKKSFFIQQDVVITDVTSIEKPFLSLLVLKTQRLDASLNNVLFYNKVISELNKTQDKDEAIIDVIKFISNHKEIFSEYVESERKSLKTLIESCIALNKTDNKLYRIFINTIVENVNNKNFNFIGKPNIELGKVKILITENYLSLSDSTIDYLNDESKTELLPLLFEKNEEQILEFLDNSNQISQIPIIAILKANIANDIKTQTINISFSEYKNNSEFLDLSIHHIINTDGKNIDESVKQSLRTVDCNKNNVVKLFNTISDKLPKEHIKQFAENQSNTEFKKLATKSKHPKFPKNNDSKKMLDFLESEKIITGYHPEKNYYRVNKVLEY